MTDLDLHQAAQLRYLAGGNEAGARAASVPRRALLDKPPHWSSDLKRAPPPQSSASSLCLSLGVGSFPLLLAWGRTLDVGPVGLWGPSACRALGAPGPRVWPCGPVALSLQRRRLLMEKI
ncbi:unnamed protein product [Arctogadus glacialis]